MKKHYRNLNPLTSLKNHFHNNATFQNRVVLVVYIYDTMFLSSQHATYQQE